MMTTTFLLDRCVAPIPGAAYGRSAHLDLAAGGATAIRTTQEPWARSRAPGFFRGHAWLTGADHPEPRGPPDEHRDGTRGIRHSGHLRQLTSWSL